MERWAVIGLDGVSYNLLDPLLARGRLPNLARLIDAGARAELASSVPWQTPVAWSSYATGVNPGEHGVFGWWQPDPLSGVLRPAGGGAIDLARFWEVLSAAGLRVGVVNVPMTYPARPVHGFHVVGLDSPWFEAETDPLACYPRGLIDDLRKAGVQYRILPDLHPDDDVDTMARGWLRVEEARVEGVLALIRERQPDFLQVNLFVTDFIAHRATPESEVLALVFETVDALVGRLVAGLAEDTNVLVVSDHGSLPIDKFVMIHNVLRAEGVLAFHPWLADEHVPGVLGVAASHPDARQLVTELRIGGPQARAAAYRDCRAESPGANVGFSTIDWDRTAAYCTSDYGQIRLNRERGLGAVRDEARARDVLERVRRALLTLADPHRPGPLVGEVIRRDDVYRGRRAGDAPDLTPVLIDHSYYFCQVYSSYRGGEQRAVAPVAEVVDPIATGCVGDHHPFGILVASGPAVRATGTIPAASILDVAPTMLARYGLTPLPEHDGTVLEDLFGGQRSEVRAEARQVNLTPGLRERLIAIGYRV